MSKELDAEIAERVMGLSVMRWINYPEATPVLSQTGREPLNYSTNISDAWLVVEKMRERGYDTVIAAGNGCCRVSVHPAMQPHQSVHNPFLAMITAETAPLAICRAALEACNGEP